MSPLETPLDVGVALRSKLNNDGNVYSIYPVTRDIDVALTTTGENGELTLDDKLKTYDEKHQESSTDIANLKKRIWSGTKEEFLTAIENDEIADGTTVYITDDYSGEGQDLSEYAKVEYVDSISEIVTRLDGDATVEGSVSYKIAEVVSGAPEKYDTLVEIANWIQSDTDGAAAMDLKIAENAKNIELKLDKDGGDTVDNITTFTSDDATDATSWTDVDTITSGEKHSGLFSKISTMFKNIRYLYKLLGTTDISSIGDGTTTGAISTLMEKFTKEAVTRYKLSGITVDLSTLPNGIFIVSLTNLTYNSALGAIGLVQKSNSSNIYMVILSKTSESDDWTVTKSGTEFTINGTKVSSSMLWSLALVHTNVV